MLAFAWAQQFELFTKYVLITDNWMKCTQLLQGNLWCSVFHVFYQVLHFLCPHCLRRQSLILVRWLPTWLDMLCGVHTKSWCSVHAYHLWCECLMKAVAKTLASKGLPTLHFVADFFFTHILKTVEKSTKLSEVLCWLCKHRQWVGSNSFE